MYVLVKNNEIAEYPYSLRRLKQDNPTVSFPIHVADELLESHGVFRVEFEECGEFDIATHSSLGASSPVLKEGNWVIEFSIIEKTQGEKDEYIAEQSAFHRLKRNELLSNSDWTQLLDANLTESEKQSWVTYRQELRDLTDRAEFPLSISWPTRASQ